MQELLSLIPYMDLGIGVLLVFFLYLGWNHGVPRFAMVLGSIYTGFLLASVYYHLLSITLSSLFGVPTGFVADLVSFVVAEVLVTVLMLALLLSLFGHVEIGGRLAVFDKVGGAFLGLFAGALAVGILVLMLRVPYEANKEKLNAANDMPVVQLFNQNYEKALLPRYFIRAAPVLLYAVKPMLPDDAQQKGAVPLLESIVSQK